MEISDTSATAQARARTWTKVHQHLGSAPGPLTYEMVHQAAADYLEESDDLDWKRDLPEPPRNGHWNEFAKDVSAMANTRGGLLIYGVANDHKVVGVDWDKADLRQYAQWVRNHVHPYLPDLAMFRLSDGAKTLLVVDVPASEMAPHLVHGRSDKDKEQQAFTVPYRDRDHTAWMAEHQIERAYRDRFTRTGSAEDALRQHTDFLTRTITAHATGPSAWLIAVARPTRPLPQGVPPLDRDEARSLLSLAEKRGRTLTPRHIVGPMTGMGTALSNPRPGLRRWVSSTLELDLGRSSMIELHHDGTVTIVSNVSWRPRSEEDRLNADRDIETDSAVPVSQRVIEAGCGDLIAAVQEVQRKLRLDSTQQIIATIYASNGPGPLEPRTAGSFGDGRESTPPYARTPHHIQPVHTLLSPIAGDEEAGHAAQELTNDLMSQFGL
ncbi:AlbA family DNA-binding domain-containing protein [Streptomyces cyaneofuscatus]|uniref:AlbA family DNA-binding domain-containing protein n=1 Tax=Streptomyces cyaneofuscatus TaxID=66883 RepID=UPI00344404D1